MAGSSRTLDASLLPRIVILGAAVAILPAPAEPAGRIGEPLALQVQDAPPLSAHRSARPTRRQLLALIDETAARFDVETALVRAIVAAESAYDDRAVSLAGARGLMQVMPATAADYGVARAEALFDPAVNVRTGVRHLRRLLDKYGGDYGCAIMAYNAGEGAVDRADGQLSYVETLDYTERVLRYYRANGGARPTRAILSKVSALRRARVPDAGGIAASKARLSGKRGSAGRSDAPAFWPDLAEGLLDRALRSDVADGDFEDSL